MSSLFEQLEKNDPDFQNKLKKLFTTTEGTQIMSKIMTSQGFRDIMIEVFDEAISTGTVDQEMLEAKIATAYHKGNLDFDL